MVWAKQKYHKDFKELDAKEYFPCRDFERDPTGYYVLIRVDFTKLEVQCGVVKPDHHIILQINGRKSQDVYHAIFDAERKSGEVWFSHPEHIAYIGKELKKAEIALALGNSAYYQE